MIRSEILRTGSAILLKSYFFLAHFCTVRYRYLSFVYSSEEEDYVALGYCLRFRMENLAVSEGL